MESTETSESPGKYLKATRESQKLSLKEVADATRIREVILRAIEEDKYEGLPHLYVKSFLSAYAGCLGLDSKEVILLHQKYLEGLAASERKDLRHQAVPRKRRINVRVLAIAISVLLLVALVYASFKLLRRGSPPLGTEESKPSSSSSLPSSNAAQKEPESSTAGQPGRNEIQPSDPVTDNEP